MRLLDGDKLLLAFDKFIAAHEAEWYANGCLTEVPPHVAWMSARELIRDCDQFVVRAIDNPA